MLPSQAFSAVDEAGCWTDRRSRAAVVRVIVVRRRSAREFAAGGAGPDPRGGVLQRALPAVRGPGRGAPDVRAGVQARRRPPDDVLTDQPSARGNSARTPTRRTGRRLVNRPSVSSAAVSITAGSLVGAGSVVLWVRVVKGVNRTVTTTRAAGRPSAATS